MENKKKIIVFALLTINLFTCIGFPCVTVGSNQEPYFNYVNFYPNPPLTIRDNIVTYANITSDTRLKSVTLYLSIINTTTKPTDLNYTPFQMWTFYKWEQNTAQKWEVVLPKISQPYDIEFYITAIDQNNQTGTYYSREDPRVIPIINVPKPYISFYSLNLSEMIHKNYGSFANLTLDIQGQLPYPDFGYDIPVNAKSTASLSNFYGMSAYEGGRFWYIYHTNVAVPLDGENSQYPYDSYTIRLEISILLGVTQLKVLISYAPISY
jgi:hypothetical protein